MITCDKCNKSFDMKLKVKKHPDEVEETYFICPYCKEKYIAYFTDKNIRVKQKRINKLWEKYRVSTTQEELIENLKNVEDLKVEIKKDMTNLRTKILGTR